MHITTIFDSSTQNCFIIKVDITTDKKKNIPLVGRAVVDDTEVVGTEVVDTEVVDTEVVGTEVAQLKQINTQFTTLIILLSTCLGLQWTVFDNSLYSKRDTS